MICCFALSTIFSCLAQFVLSQWSDDKTCDTATEEICNSTTNNFIKMYTIYILTYAVFCVLRSIVSVPARMKAARKIHDNLLDVILDAPVSFHDITPVGRVLNRFNKDMNLMDDEIPRSLLMFMTQLFNLIAEVINISWSTRGIMIIVMIIAFIIFWTIQSNFRRANTDIQRIESLTRTPIFTDFQGVLTGSPSIRAYGHQQRFIDGIENRLDTNNNCMMNFQ